MNPYFFKYSLQRWIRESVKKKKRKKKKKKKKILLYRNVCAFFGMKSRYQIHCN
jgi:hypothetical protein